MSHLPLSSVLDSLRQDAPTEVDLTSPEDLDAVISLAESLLEHSTDPAELSGLADPALDLPLGLAVAVKLALSKTLVAELAKEREKPVLVSVLFAVYAEHERILPPEQNPVGEDFLRRKVKQLEWLFDEFPEFDWELIVVDDGCPEGSGRIAEKIIAEDDFGNRVRIRFLEEAIRDSLPGTGDLASTRESQKGGAILYGLWDAIEHRPGRFGDDGHIVLYTDADLSTHLGQVGLLLDPLLGPEGAAAAIGSRRERESVVVKVGTRNTRGKLFIYLWKRLVSVLPNVIDTQCAFKAFPVSVAREIITPAIEKKFAFDIELLIKTSLLERGPIATVPLAWIDSEAASTTTDLEPYLPMLQAIVRMYREYLPPSPDSEPFADFIESLEEEEWSRLVESVPAAIAECEPFELGAETLVPAESLREAATG
jgi:hypothetical protein